MAKKTEKRNFPLSERFLSREGSALPDNSFPIAHETEIFLFAVLLGAGLGVLFDILRVFRAVVPHGKILTFIEDFLFTLICGFSLFSFSVGLTGQIRWFSIIGMAIGCILEMLTIGGAVVFIVRKFANSIRKFIIAPVWRFITKLWRKIRSAFVKKYLKFCKIKKSAEKPLKVDF